MEKKCIKCGKPAKVICICNTSLWYCNSHGIDHTTTRNHKLIKLVKYQLNEGIRLKRKKLDKRRSDIIFRSYYSIKVIKSLAICELSQIQYKYTQIEKLQATENPDSNTFMELENYGNIEIPRSNLDELDSFIIKNNKTQRLETFKKNTTDKLKNNLFKINKPEDAIQIVCKNDDGLIINKPLGWILSIVWKA